VHKFAILRRRQLCLPGGYPLRNAIPPIQEKVATLKERLRHEHDGHKKPRLQMLYLLASRQAPTRQDAARLLGVHRNTISRWLALYTAGGMDALLATYVPAGKPVSLATAQRLTLPENVRLVFLPPYCPELDPIERVWRDLKDAMAWLQFTHLDAQQDHIATLLRAYQAATLQALTGYPYLVEAIHALCP
jgi:transposase